MMSARLRSLLLGAALLASQLPLGAVTVGVDQVSEGMGAVTWTQQAAPHGTAALSLQATSSSGAVFAGWLVDDLLPDWPVDYRLARPGVVEVPTNAVVSALFVDPSEDYLEFDIADSLSEFEFGEEVSVHLEIYSASFPKLTFQGLPAGLVYNARSLTVSGRPRTPGIFTVKATGVNQCGFTYTQTFKCRVWNQEGARLVGMDTSVPVGKYFNAEFTDLFALNGEWDTNTVVSLTGLPPGLEWKPSWNLLYGTPTRIGVSTIKATVRYTDGRYETATLLFEVESPSLDEYSVDFMALENCTLGEEIESRTAEVGIYSNKVGIISISGLPPGLSAEIWHSDGVYHYGIRGVPTLPGIFPVTVKVAENFDGQVSTVTLQHEVLVVDVPSTYLKVSVLNTEGDELGSVSGGGAVSLGARVTVSARPKSGAVFAGWFDGDGNPVDFRDGTDYRTPTVTFSRGTDFSFVELFAAFVPKSEDTAVEFDGLDGEAFVFNPEGYWEAYFTVDSRSLPSLTFTGLPAGVVLRHADDEQTYILCYDAEQAVRQPRPGRYAVTAKAVSQSRASDTSSFRITVENWYDPRVAVEDDYGAHRPGVDIEPIDLSDAVDFSLGETLSVSGLPAGLVFNRTANARTGAAANTVTGRPTVPGDYTLTFTAKVATSVSTSAAGRTVYGYSTVKVTSFITVLPYPRLSVEMDPYAEASGNKVQGGGNYKQGSKATLTAKPAAGWVFAGWQGVEGDALALKNPVLPMTTGEEDRTVSATFVEIRDDTLELHEPDLTERGFAAEFTVGAEIGGTASAMLVHDLIVTESLPALTVTGLPPGVKYAARTFLLSGKPTKAGVYAVTVSARNAGGYTFVRVLDMAVRGSDGTLPSAKDLGNAAAIDFTPLSGLVVGRHYPDGSLSLQVAPQQGTTAAVRKVAVSGQPAGLAVRTEVAEGGARVMFSGTCQKPGRFVLTVTTTYENGKTAKSQFAYVVADQVSRYLSVENMAPGQGTVTGADKVYAAGATVRLSARAASKHVFTGWFRGGRTPFEALGVHERTDYRTASVSFTLRPADFGDEKVCQLFADFLPVADDAVVEISGERQIWMLEPGEPSDYAFTVSSRSRPVLTTRNLPKGVTLDAVAGRLVYDGNPATVSGIYAATLSARNQSKAASPVFPLEIRVANRVSDVIQGIDPDWDAYPLVVGTVAGPSLPLPEVPEGWLLSVKGLPSGLSYKAGAISGRPTKAGDYTVTLTATSGSGKDRLVETATMTLRVAALPDMAVGTFGGFLRDGAGRMAGTITLKTSASGKLSAKVVTVSGGASFSASAWSAFAQDEGGCAELLDRSGNGLALAFDAQAPWNAWQMTGTCRVDGRDFDLKAQRTDWKTVAQEPFAPLAGTYERNGLKVTVSSAGTVKVAGRCGSDAVSASSTLFYEDGWRVRFLVFVGKSRWYDVFGEFAGDSFNMDWDVYEN